jgi:hypothetical protein
VVIRVVAMAVPPSGADPGNDGTYVLVLPTTG